jgi:futalosine hydrolase
MNILLVAATAFEIAPVIEKFKNTGVNERGLQIYAVNSNTLTVLITGVGMVATAFALGKHLNSSYTMVINAGIAGSFSSDFAIGDVVQVNEDCFAELGAEDDTHFLTINQLGFGDNTIKNTNTVVNDELKKVTQVNGITVNKVHGNPSTIAKTLARFKPVTESMEGAAFLFACSEFNIPSVQLRAVSNYVEKRNKASWNIPLAIKNLNQVLEKIICTL